MTRSWVAIAGALVGCGDNLEPPPMFEKVLLDPAYRTEGAAIFDADNDGHADIVTDQRWFAGPGWTPHEVSPHEEFDPQSYARAVSAWGDDLDADGWIDLVVAPFPWEPMRWYRNPAVAGTHWTPSMIAPAFAASMEQPVYVDLFGDGRRVVIAGNEPLRRIGYYTPEADPTMPWTFHPVGPPGVGATRYLHGLGAGDVDGDGRLDVLASLGWFAQTEDREAWVFHPFDFSDNACSTMHAEDLDGDGRADVLCATPHAYGLYWWRQHDAGFERRELDASISQLGALGLGDLDGDGTPELVTGKNWLAHPAGDPGTEDPAVLVYYRTRPDGAGGVTVERHVVDEDSGIGRQVTIGDVNADGRPDIVEATKKGTFLFVQR